MHDDQENDTLYNQITGWDNLRLAYHNAARGKRGRAAAARFEYHLADNLLELQAALQQQRYQPGGYTSFYIHEPKRRLISAAPFCDRGIEAPRNETEGSCPQYVIPMSPLFGRRGIPET